MCNNNVPALDAPYGRSVCQDSVNKSTAPNIENTNFESFFN